MNLKLRYYGDPVLRKRAEPIKEITPEIRQLAADMIEAMWAWEGIGLAAPQVGVLLRMFVSPINAPDAYAPYGDPVVYINPVVSNVSDEITEMNEGCLSLPGISAGPVPRPYSCTIDAIDLDGNPFQTHCTDFFTRNVLHEIDHLNGVLFFDRIKGKQRRLLEPQLRKIKVQYKTKG